MERLRAPAPEQVERFRRDLSALAPEPSPDRPLALAVSGGPDSMAMLALAHAAWPGAVIAATVDHRLRPEAAAEAAMVAQACAALGVPHATLALDLPSGNVQAMAREHRYARLAEWAAAAGARRLATAHHADDQAETFLMRAARGSGAAGLAGIRARRALTDGVELVRPLLGWRRAELAAIVAATGMPQARDPSNDDLHYDRTRFRRLLAENAWLDVPALAASAAHAADADRALGEITEWLWRVRRLGSAPDEVLLDPSELPREALRRLVRRAIGQVREAGGVTAPAFPAAANVEPLLDALLAGHGASQAGVMVSAGTKGWRFRVAPPRRSH